MSNTIPRYKKNSQTTPSYLILSSSTNRPVGSPSFLFVNEISALGWRNSLKNLIFEGDVRLMDHLISIVFKFLLEDFVDDF